MNTGSYIAIFLICTVICALGLFVKAQCIYDENVEDDVDNDDDDEYQNPDNWGV